MWPILYIITDCLCLWLPIIIGILHVYDGRPLADWPLPITRNALIAFISTACRTAFIFSLVQALAQQRWDWYESPRSLGDFSVFMRLREEYGESDVIARCIGSRNMRAFNP
ncbi:uncharacterized protein QC763_200785 [Podospora pseudopauciseta]|uniref:Uncharacterized protein n=1 Tax=Podospora pseudopauciseta TaxID=2093780 RepID=A0ABR0HMW1_9PEZI|nr:hypothetical protein QC763_200785 [Podospora pseudopauciseta]